MACNTDNQLKYRCGSITPSECVVYDSDLPSWSELEGCVTVEESLTEIYKKLTELSEAVQIEDLPNCIELPAGEQTLSSVLLGLATEICAIKDKISSAPTTFDVSKLAISSECLVDECGAPISDLTTLLQVIIDKLCIN